MLAVTFCAYSDWQRLFSCKEKDIKKTPLQVSTWGRKEASVYETILPTILSIKSLLKLTFSTQKTQVSRCIQVHQQKSLPYDDFDAVGFSATKSPIQTLALQLNLVLTKVEKHWAYYYFIRGKKNALFGKESPSPTLY